MQVTGGVILKSSLSAESKTLGRNLGEGKKRPGCSLSSGRSRQNLQVKSTDGDWWVIEFSIFYGNGVVHNPPPCSRWDGCVVTVSHSVNEYYCQVM